MAVSDWRVYTTSPITWASGTSSTITFPTSKKGCNFCAPSVQFKGLAPDAGCFRCHITSEQMWGYASAPTVSTTSVNYGMSATHTWPITPIKWEAK